MLITLAAGYIGISLGTNDCPSCVIANMFDSSGDASTEDESSQEVVWSVTDLNGQEITNQDLKGKVSVVMYWATWCGGCKKEIPDLVALREEFPSNELEIIGLSFDKEHKDLKTYAEAAGINYRIARITPSVKESLGEADAIPTVFILDQKGRVQFSHSGVIGKTILAERVRSLMPRKNEA
ncbi:redoxin domain-containing protein [Pelagicoccus albus]|uniref:TlpA family protein disulfide reductase n=1 Tax=Pelagicoccus albus TaxID=415222 RepID=A0A7X1B8E4_9BACT|nr:TlpA family protein disulfide reductase [Pelagicoccus albus]